MAINIKHDKSIKGLNIGNVNIKVTQYADDTTLFLEDTASLKKHFQTIRQFSVICRIKVEQREN